MLAYIRKISETKNSSDEGASAVEYGLLIAAIAAVIVAVVFGLGTLVNNAFSDTSNCIAGKGTSGATTAC